MNESTVDISVIEGAVKIDDVMRDKYRDMHFKADQAKRVLSEAMEAALTAAVNVNVKIDVERDELNRELDAKIGSVPGGWVIDTQAGYAVPQQAFDLMMKQRHRH